MLSLRIRPVRSWKRTDPRCHQRRDSRLRSTRCHRPALRQRGRRPGVPAAGSHPPRPLPDPRYPRVPRFLTANIVAFCAYFATFAVFFFTAFVPGRDRRIRRVPDCACVLAHDYRHDGCVAARGLVDRHSRATMVHLRRMPGVRRGPASHRGRDQPCTCLPQLAAALALVRQPLRPGRRSPRCGSAVRFGQCRAGA